MKFGSFLQIDDYSYVDLGFVVGFELHESNEGYYWYFLMSTDKEIIPKSKTFKTKEEANKWIQKKMKNGG